MFFRVLQHICSTMLRLLFSSCFASVVVAACACCCALVDAFGVVLDIYVRV